MSTTAKTIIRNTNVLAFETWFTDLSYANLYLMTKTKKRL